MAIVGASNRLVPRPLRLDARCCTSMHQDARASVPSHAAVESAYAVSLWPDGLPHRLLCFLTHTHPHSPTLNRTSSTPHPHLLPPRPSIGHKHNTHRPPCRCKYAPHAVLVCIRRIPFWGWLGRLSVFLPLFLPLPPTLCAALCFVQPASQPTCTHIYTHTHTHQDMARPA